MVNFQVQAIYIPTLHNLQKKVWLLVMLKNFGKDMTKNEENSAQKKFIQGLFSCLENICLCCVF